MKRTRPLRRVRKKRQAQLKVYAKRKKVFLEEHPFCFVCLRNLPFSKRTLHHFFGRVDELLCFVPGFRTGCFDCHDYIEKHRKEAIDKGWRADEKLFNRPSLVISMFT